jgi:hypothetical protein
MRTHAVDCDLGEDGTCPASRRRAKAPRARRKREDFTQPHESGPKNSAEYVDPRQLAMFPVGDQTPLERTRADDE